MAEVQTTKLNTMWVLKTGVFMLVLLVFGLWGLADGMYFYPKRGLADASFQFQNFLKAADNAGRLTTANLAVPDPKAALKELESKSSELELTAKSGVGAAGDTRKALMDLMKLEWLRSLSKAWRLNPDPKPLGTVESAAGAPTRKLFLDMSAGEGYSVTADGQKSALSPQALLNDLKNYWDTSAKPSPLSVLDMLFQWVFVAIGLIGGVWILLVILRAKATKFTWEPETQRLTLPGGKSLVPADLEDVDKRQWHKYFATLVDKNGASHKMDLLRFVPLEEWVLAMESTRFPERAEEAAREKAEREAAEQEEEAAAASTNEGKEGETNPNT